MSMLIQIKYIIVKINFTFNIAFSHTPVFMKSSSKTQKERSHNCDQSCENGADDSAQACLPKKTVMKDTCMVN